MFFSFFFLDFYNINRIYDFSCFKILICNKTYNIFVPKRHVCIFTSDYTKQVFVGFANLHLKQLFHMFILVMFNLITVAWFAITIMVN